MKGPGTKKMPGRSACPKFWPGCSPTGSKLSSAAQTCSPRAQACYGPLVSDTSDIIEQICAEHADREGPLLSILHAVQARFGCVDEAAERVIAQALNLTRAEVHGVVSFYHDFRGRADPRPTVQICRAEACQARGRSEEHTSELQSLMRISYAVFCLK